MSARADEAWSLSATYPTHPTYQTYQTYPTYPTYPTHATYATCPTYLTCSDVVFLSSSVFGGFGGRGRFIVRLTPFQNGSTFRSIS